MLGILQTVKKLFHPLAPKRVANTEMNQSWITPKQQQQQQQQQQQNKQTNKQKIKITGTNYISRFLVERNYLAAFIHKRFRNYLLKVHWIVLTLNRNGI